MVGLDADAATKRRIRRQLAQCMLLKVTVGG